MTEYEPGAGGYPAAVTPPTTNPTSPTVVDPNLSLERNTNIRWNNGSPLKFNCAIPNVLHSSSLYRAPVDTTSGKPIYRENGFNERGMIVRDFNMNDRLAMADQGWASTTGNWGFQFHFNPPDVIESFAAPMGIDYAGFILDIAKNPLLVTSTQTGASVQFNLLLARAEDMRILSRDDWQAHYPLLNRPTEADRSMILAKGTQYDLEYLFRVVNLDPVMTWRGETSDWGMLMGTPVVVSLGDSDGCRKYRGSLASVGVQHQQYAPGMVPVYTIVQINLTRITDMYGMDRGEEASAESASPSMPLDPNEKPVFGPPQYNPSPSTRWANPVPSDWLIHLGFKTKGSANYSLGAHTGIDLWKPRGADSMGGAVYAVDDGEVAHMGNSSALGNELVIKLKSGPYVSYGHLLDITGSLKVGSAVRKGSQVGRVGKSGMSGGAKAHLHLEVRTEKKWRSSWSIFQDPAQWLLGKSSVGWTASNPHSLKR